MKRKSLKSHLLLGTLIPGILCALLASACIAYLFLNSHRDQAVQQQHSNLLLLGHYISLNLENQSDDLQQSNLKELGDIVLNIPDIRSLSLYDQQFHPIYHYGPEFVEKYNWDNTQINLNSSHTSQQFHGKNLRLLEPVSLQRTLTEINASKPSTQQYFWIDAEYSNIQVKLMFYRTVLVLTILILLILFFATVLSARLIQKGTKPIASLEKQLAKVQSGSLDARMPDSTIKEFQVLASILNSTLETLQIHQDELQENVDQSTQDLRETLETIEIQNIELDLARKEALQASKIKSEFLANTSHEIRTPLNGIIGFTRLLLKQTNDPQQLEYLKTIQQSSEGLLAIINDILDLSKIEAGKLVLEYIDFNIHTVIEEILQILSPGAHEKGLELTYVVNSQVPENLMGDPHRIKQILTNLIGNAIKFSDQGNVVIRVHLEQQNGNQALIKFNVSDSGIGIAKNNLNDDLFKAFTQTEGSYNRQHGGTGLGLAISQKLVTQMGGDIGIESEENIGSTFWFTLKLDISTDLSNYYQNNQCTQNILLFDINTASRQHLSQQLMAFGANVSVCSSLNDVLPLLANNSNQNSSEWIDTVIISLPVDSSIFPIERLPKLVDEIQSYCRIIIHTPRAIKYYLSKSLPEKIILLNKPCDRKSLYKALNNDLGPTVEKQGSTAKVSIPTHNKTYKILCIDDNEANLKLISTLLREQGHNVFDAHNGFEGIKFCQQESFDIIFMDIQMPELDGIATSQRIRSLNNHNKNTPIVALTAHALNTQRQELLLAGLDDYLSKPASDEQLKKIITRWCDQNTSSAQTNKTIEPTEAPSNSVDKALSLELSNGKRELACNMLSMLLDELPNNQMAINIAIEKNDIEEAIELTHKLHGSTCYCGVPLLKAASKNLEISLLKEKSISHVLVEKLNREIDTLLTWKETHDINTFFS